MRFKKSIESDEDVDLSASEDENNAQTSYFNSDFQFADTEAVLHTDTDMVDVGIYLKKKRLISTDEKINEVLSKDCQTNGVNSTDEAGDCSDNTAEIPDKVTTNLAEAKRKKRKASRTKSVVLENNHASTHQGLPDMDSIDVSKSADDSVKSFHELNLSRPLLKTLCDIGFVQPTPIQRVTIPVALMGRDICGCAATGTGKTAAFVLPTLERLYYKPVQGALTRVLILLPTRELCVQVYKVTCQLAQHIPSINICLVAGGMDLKMQEVQLRRRPDIVIATPGRLIDHLHNTSSTSLDAVEVLILDEADRMLDEYFAEQMSEIIRQCSPVRQTMLFSATMSADIKQLAAISLNNPVKIFVNENTDVAARLRQEFVKVREKKEADREAILCSLLERTYRTRVMVFVRTKWQTHRLHILLGLIGLKVSELHGNLSQAQRLKSLQLFRDGDVNILLATDVAARGLDIPGVETVINLNMPSTIKQYVHRVGRTARAGRSGVSVSLACEGERQMLRQISRSSLLPLQTRTIALSIIDKYRARIKALETKISEVINMEKHEREIRIAENQLSAAERKLRAEATQTAVTPSGETVLTTQRPRVWFQSHCERIRANKKNQEKFKNSKLVQELTDERTLKSVRKRGNEALRQKKSNLRKEKLSIKNKNKSKRKR